MSFSEKAKLTAMAIVHIFETSKPFGEFDAYVILDDGAGVSYGLSQFTHRSGSLLAVIDYYLDHGGSVGSSYFNSIHTILSSKTTASITKLSKDKSFKSWLQKAAKTPEMQAAQSHVAQTKYFQKAIDACTGSNFILPLSLAVIYDSINHGSWEKIRDRVKISDTDEKAWISQYVRNRDAWLESVPRLKKTDYRTDFFLAQIARQNWQLNLPLNVHGYTLTAKMFAGENSRPTASVEPLADLPDETRDDGADAIQAGDANNRTAKPNIPDDKSGELSSGVQPPATELCKERPSTFVRWFVAVKSFFGYVIAAIGSWIGFDDVKEVLKDKTGNLDAATVEVLAIVLFKTAIIVGAGVLLAYLASKLYDKAANRANGLNMQKLIGAQSRDLNTAEFKS